MSDRTAFMQAICTNPNDDTPRLVFADWLEERDEGQRAEFIRVQCELARMPNLFGPDFTGVDRGLRCMECGDECGDECGEMGCGKPDCVTRWNRRTILKHRERKLFQQSNATHSWFGKAIDMVIGGSDWMKHLTWFRRGFLHSVTCDADDWLEYGDALTWRPEQMVTCPDGVLRGEVAFHFGCERCKGTRFIERPFPETAQPIRHVELKTPPRILIANYQHFIIDGDSHQMLHRQRDFTDAYHNTSDTNLAKWCCEKRWPGIEFDVPSMPRGYAAGGGGGSGTLHMTGGPGVSTHAGGGSVTMTGGTAPGGGGAGSAVSTRVAAIRANRQRVLYRFGNAACMTRELTGRMRYRISSGLPDSGRRGRPTWLSAWCLSEERAWQAAARSIADYVNGRIE